MRRISVLIVGLSLFTSFFAVSADWKEKTVRNFKAGKIEDVRQTLSSFSPYTAEDKSFIMFYKAKIQLDKTSTQNLLLELTQKYPERKYGQLGFLELAKLYYSDGKYSLGIEQLGKITDNENAEKFFWLSRLQYQDKKYDSSIQSARKFIEKGKSSDLKELAYLQIVENKLAQKKFYDALEILDEFKNSTIINHQIPALLYKLGYCHEKIGNIDKSTKYYQKVINEFTYTKFANDSRLRLQKLGNLNAKSTSTQKEPQGKQSYLQAGAFTSNKNANRRLQQIKELGFEGHVFEIQGKFKVAVGPFSSSQKLKTGKQKLKDNNISTFKIVK